MSWRTPRILGCAELIGWRRLKPTLLVVRDAGEDLGCVACVGAAVPEGECVLRVVCAGAQFCGEDCAADREACGGIAECGERFRGETVFARHLSHYLHQAPGN